MNIKINIYILFKNDWKNVFYKMNLKKEIYFK